MERVAAGAPAIRFGGAAAGRALQDRFVPHRSDGCGARGRRHAAAGFVRADEGFHERLPGRVREVALRLAVLYGCVG